MDGYSYDKNISEHVYKPTDFGKRYIQLYLKFQTALTIFQFIGVAIGTVFTLKGLWKMSTHGQHPAIWNEQMNSNRQMCLLQLSEALPLLITCFLEIFLAFDYATVTPLSALISADYSSATRHLNKVKRNIYLFWRRSSHCGVVWSQHPFI